MKDPYNVCLLNDSFPPIIDGVANAVVNYAGNIEHNGGHSLVMTPQVPGADDSMYSFPVIRYPSIDTRRMIGYVTGYPFSPEAAHAAEKAGLDILHTHCPVTSCILARSLAESLDLPLVLTWHTKYDIDIANAVSSKVLQEGALQALLRNVNACDEIWTVSRGAGENLRSIGYEGDYIVMPNGVDLPRLTAGADEVDAVTAGHDLPGDIPCYLFIGRLMWYKGLRIILDALALLRDRGRDYRMVFVGGGGDSDEVIAYTRELGLADRVFFTGPISDRDKLRAWYTRADLFLFPSTFDTNGLVVREAAASDTAAVIVENSCASEGVTDGRNGFLIDENAESLAAKLIEIADHPGLAAQVGHNAGTDLYISWETAVSNAYDRYGAVIDNYRSGLYGSRDPLKGSWMRSQGELMQILGNLDAAGRTIRQDVEAVHDELQDAMWSRRNKAIVDLITAGYETHQAIEEIQHEARRNLKNIRDEVTSQIRETGEELWDRLERYL